MVSIHSSVVPGTGGHVEYMHSIEPFHRAGAHATFYHFMKRNAVNKCYDYYIDNVQRLSFLMK